MQMTENSILRRDLVALHLNLLLPSQYCLNCLSSNDEASCVANFFLPHIIFNFLVFQPNKNKEGLLKINEAYTRLEIKPRINLSKLKTEWKVAFQVSPGT